MKRYSLLLCMLTSSVSFAQQSIVPCVRQGVCSFCNSGSCRGCPSMNSVQPISEEDTGQPCKICKDESVCCPVTTDGRFVDDAGNTNCRAGCSPPYSAFIPRSQGTNTARELVGWEEFIHQFDVGDYYITTGHVLAYYRSFRPERITQELFGDTVLRFAGSRVADRAPCELLADNFGLSANFRGTLTADPLIENIVFDNQFFIGLDPWLCGLYMRFHAPLVHTRWDLRLCAQRDKRTCPPFAPCYMSQDAADATCDILRALSGEFTFGDMQEPWQYGRITDGVHTETKLADIDVIVGYDFKQSDTYHVGFYGQLGMPTGNRFTACRLFEPIVGNAHHAELGLGFSAHVILYEHTAESSLALWVEGNVVHMFKNTQMRSFDFCRNGPLSRYLLLKELVEQDGTLVYSGRLINAINFATREVDVSIAAKGDISAKLAVRTPRIIADVGYNFYGRTDEKVCLRDTCDMRIYAIKGTEGVCGREYTTVGDEPPIMFGEFVRNVPLNSSQSDATIRVPGQTDKPEEPQKVNPTDIVIAAYSLDEGPIEAPGVIRAFESNPPITVSVKDLYIPSGAAPAQATHKVFGYLGYNFYECDWCYNPYLGLGGEIEFDARSCEERSALNQWSVFVKGGFEF